MKLKNKFIGLATLMAMLGTSAAPLAADDCCPAPEGCGYNDCCESSCLTPAIALGAIAAVAIIAVVVTDPFGHHHHGHSGSSNAHN